MDDMSNNTSVKSTTLNDAIDAVDWGDINTYSPFVPDGVDPVHYLKYVRSRFFANSQMVTDRGLVEDMIEFLDFAKTHNLNPVKRDVYAIYRETRRGSGQYKMSIVVSIGAKRRKAASNPSYMGQKEYEPIFNENQELVACRATVLKLNPVNGEIVETSYTAYASENQQTLNNPIGKTRPIHMLGKVAESHALERAFPNEAAQIYTHEEFGLESTKAIEADSETKEALKAKLKS